MSGQPESPIDWSRLTENTFVESIEHRLETESTNTLASQIGQTETINLPCLVIADRQISGRGRGNNRWISSSGSLTFSLIVDVTNWSIPAERTPLISLATGVAISQAVDQILPVDFLRCQLKWPNDIYLCERKLGGILIESVPYDSNRFIIGVGLNVNNRIAEELEATAITLRDVTERETSLCDVVEFIVVAIDDQLKRLAFSPASILNDWANRCLLTGRSVRIEHTGNETTGTCLGIDDTGALLIQTETGPQRFIAGSILEFE